MQTHVTGLQNAALREVSLKFAPVVLQISQHFLPQETGKADLLATPSQNDAVSGASLDAALSSEVEPLGIADADLQVLASLLASFVSSGKKPGEQFLACCAARFQQLLGHEFNDTAVASVLEALAMFGYNPAPCHVDAAAAAISANLQVSLLLPVLASLRGRGW